MKKHVLKQMLVFAICLFTYSGIWSQTMPVISTDGNDVWYYIQFKNGFGVMQDMGNNTKILTKAAVKDKAEQLWKVTGAVDNYVFTSQTGRKINFSTTASRFQTSSTTNSTFKFKATTNSTYTPGWELQRVGSTQYINQFGGAGLEKQLGEWSFADPNNPLKFVLPSEMGFKPEKPTTEATITGSAAAPASKLSLWYRTPATDWMTQALPIGNGQFGGMIFGGIKQDYELAFKYLSEASNEGCDGANPYLAEFYENGVYVGKDMQQAIKYFYLSGKYYFDKAKKCERLAGIDSASAPKSEIEGYLKYAEGPDDDARAMYALSQVYLFGLNDVEKNSELGMEWLKKAADKGLTIAMSELGDYLISKDEYEEAIKLLEVCSLKGHQMSMKNLAQAYRILEIRGKTIAEGVIPNLYIAAGDFETLRKYYPSLSRATDAELLNKQILIFQGIHQGDSRPAASQSSTNKPATNQSPVNQPPVYYPPVQQNNNYNQHQNNNQQRQPMRVLCQHCNGTGYICVVKSVPTYGTHSNVKTRCKNCSQLLDHGIVHVQKKCYHCQGKGYIEK